MVVAQQSKLLSEGEYELNIKSETITNVTKFNLNDGSIKLILRWHN